MMEYFLSPVGDDANLGTLAAPVKTFQRAQQLVRERLELKRQETVLVQIRGGLYRFTQTLQFDQRDSALPRQQVIWQAYNGETPVISGGQSIGFNPYDATTWWTYSANRIRNFYVNDSPAVRARFPNAGTYLRLKHWYNGDASSISSTELANRTITLNWADIAPGFPLDGSVEMVIQRDWARNLLKINSGTFLSGTEIAVGFAEPGSSMAFDCKYPYKYQNQSYHLEGLQSFLTEPGEWFQDQNGYILYKPKPEEVMAFSTAEIPILEKLITIEGTPNYPILNLRFDGLVFTNTDWTAPANGYVCFQGNSNVIPSVNNQPAIDSITPSQVEVKYAQNIWFENCTFKNAGANGLNFGSGVWYSTIKRSRFVNTGAAGVVFEGQKTVTQLTYPRSDSSLSKIFVDDHVLLYGQNAFKNQRNRIYNSIFTNNCIKYTSNCPIFVGLTSDTIIQNNTINSCAGAGISMGWGWTDQVIGQKNNLIFLNKIDGAMSLLTDGGAIYTLSRSNATQITGNLIKNMAISPWVEREFIAGIYLDAGSLGMTARRNVFQNISLIPGKVLKTFGNFPNSGPSFIDNDGQYADVINGAGANWI